MYKTKLYYDELGKFSNFIGLILTSPRQSHRSSETYLLQLDLNTIVDICISIFI